MVDHSTHCIAAAAGHAGAAGVSALVVDAGLVLGTGGGGPAAQHAGHPAADLLAVAVIVHSTHRLAQTIVANLVLATVLVIEADIFAELAIADLSVRTLGIAGANLRLLHTGHHRGGVGDVALGAGALGPVVHHLTLGIGSTGAGAGVGAPVVDAGVGLRTVRVLPTSHNTHFVETHVAEETVIVNTTRH